MTGDIVITDRVSADTVIADVVIADIASAAAVITPVEPESVVGKSAIQ